MVYRPTVRYDDRFREYVDQLFQATDLDRNQIIRLGLFLLGHTKEGREILSDHLKGDTSLPSPSWNHSTHGLWLEKTMREPLEAGTSEKDAPDKSEDQSIIEGKDVYAKKDGLDGRAGTATRRRGEVYKEAEQPGTIVTGSGIVARVGGALLLPRRG